MHKVRVPLLVLLLSFSWSTHLSGQTPSNGRADIGDGKLAIQAELNGPTDLAFDPSGNLYVIEMAGNRIRKIDTKSGVIETIVGHGEECLGGDCEYPDGLLGTDVIVGGLRSAVSDSHGVIYFSQIGKGLIRRIDPVTGKVESISGVGISNSERVAKGLMPCFEDPGGMAFDAKGTLFYSDTTMHAICEIRAREHKVNIIAGSGRGYAGDGGPALQARFKFPMGIASDQKGNLMIADYENHRVRRIDMATGVVSTIAGNGLKASLGDGGPAINASIAYPAAIAVDARGNVYLSAGNDNEGNIRRIAVETNNISAVYGYGKEPCRTDDGSAHLHPLRAASGLAVDKEGNLYLSNYVCNRIYKLELRTGILTVFAGNGKPDRIDSWE